MQARANRGKGGNIAMTKEKRKRLRVPVLLDIRILFVGKLIEAKLINISLTGILCTSSPHFQQDAPCQVIISLSDDIQIKIDSKIIRIGDGEAAISFSSMDEDSFAHLKRIVTYNSGDVDRIEKEFQHKAFG
jgi:hypothetical protein